MELKLKSFKTNILKITLIIMKKDIPLHNHKYYIIINTTFISYCT